MKGKHLVFFEAIGDFPAGYYVGHSTGLVGNKGLDRGDKEQATWLTQQQAKRLIDRARHAGYPCRAEPSFTVTY